MALGMHLEQGLSGLRAEGNAAIEARDPAGVAAGASACQLGRDPQNVLVAVDPDLDDS